MVPLILGQVWGKGKWLGGKSLFLSELGFVVFFFFFWFFFPPFGSRNIPGSFVIRNTLGVFFGQEPVKYHFPAKRMQGPFARRAKDFSKNKTKIQVLK